jgi:5-methylcytosine-specific restriction endonuclease McrBC regulatory subunit McrC
MNPIVVTEGALWPEEFLRDKLFHLNLQKYDKIFWDSTRTRLIERDAGGRFRVGHNWAGFIRVGEKAVYVGPKCLLGGDDIEAWSRSLPKFLEWCRDLGSSDVIISGSGLFSKSNTMLSWWADYYSKSLQRALRTTPYHKYEWSTCRLGYVRGRINWELQCGELASAGTKVWCDYRNYQADNSLNQLLKWAAKRFMNIASSWITRARLEACSALLSAVTDIPPEVSSIDRIRLPLSYAIYREPYEIARKLYAEMYPNLWTGQIPSCGIMINMVRAFEAFVDGLVQQAVKQARASGKLWFCATQAQQVLAVPAVGGGKPFYTRPDNQVWEIGIENDIKRGCVIDAKYKGSASRDPYDRPYSQDYYQVLTSCVSRGWKQGLILSPTISGEESGVTQWLTRIPTKGGGDESNVTIGLMKLDLMNLGSADGVMKLTHHIESYLEKSLLEYGKPASGRCD